MDALRFPARVHALAQTVNGEALAYREHDDGSIVIVFTDGRKLTFDKVSEVETPSDVGSSAPPPASLPPKSAPPKKKGK